MEKNRVDTVISYINMGISIGSIIVLASMIAFFGMNEILKNILVWIIASAVCGFVSLIYECEKLSHIQATAIHFPLIAVTALTAGWILDYSDGSFLLLIKYMLPEIIIIYALVHLLMFIIRRAALKSINKKLDKK